MYSKTKKFVIRDLGNTTGLKHEGFTLAEVLITLGVIGVVAAMTLPTLMSKYRGHVAVQKLKKVSSILLQTNQRANFDNGTSREGFTPQDPDAAMEMFNKYYVPYMDFERVDKGKYGVFGYLKDGVALYFYKYTTPDSWDSNTYMFVCLTHKVCEELNSEDIVNSYKKIANGKNIFALYVSGRIPSYTFRTKTHEERIQNCKEQLNAEDCTALLFEAGWSVPKDYPIRF